MAKQLMENIISRLLSNNPDPEEFELVNVIECLTSD